MKIRNCRKGHCNLMECSFKANLFFTTRFIIITIHFYLQFCWWNYKQKLNVGEENSWRNLLLWIKMFIFFHFTPPLIIIITIITIVSKRAVTLLTWGEHRERKRERLRIFSHCIWNHFINDVTQLFHVNIMRYIHLFMY